MRGHWLSGTRKLNKHYQSGGGTPADIRILTGMMHCLRGFQWNRVGGEEYSNLLSETEMQYYDNTSLTNIRFAPWYKLFDSLPVQYTQEIKHMLYAPWLMDGNGNYYTGSGSAGKWSTDGPVWRYGTVALDPYWVYDNTNTMQWDAPTQLDNRYNEDNIYRSDYYYNSNWLFETAYHDKSIIVVIPHVEIVSLADSGYSGVQQVIITNDTVFTNTYPSKVKLEGFSVVDNVRNIQRVGGLMKGSDPSSYVCLAPDNKYYIKTMNGSSTYYDRNTSECGAWGMDRDNFFGDCIYLFLKDKNGNKISAGTYTDPDTSNVFNMVYAIRTDHFEVDMVSPENLVLPYNYVLGGLQ